MNLNFFASEVIADPYPHYRAVQAQGAVVRNDLFGAWMVAGHSEAVSILRDHDRFSSNALGGEMRDRSGAFGGAATMLNSDPPDHTRLRGVVQRAFTPRAVAQLEGRVEEIVNELLAAVDGGDPFDLVDALAYPLPVIVIAEMLGVSPADRASFREWSDDVVATGNEMATGEQIERARRSAVELRAYLADVIAQRRRVPGDDLVGRLVVANDDDALSDAELMAACALLLLAGNETTTKLISSAVLALAQHPAARDRLAADRTILPAAVEELIRYAGPIQSTVRRATADARVGDVDVTAGDTVFVLLAAANRDPRQFSEPDALDLTRAPNPHVGLGHGIHFCLGATLARLETRAALAGLLARAPAYELAQPEEALEYGPSFFLRGLTRLTIAASSKDREVIA